MERCMGLHVIKTFIEVYDPTYALQGFEQLLSIRSTKNNKGVHLCRNCALQVLLYEP